MSYLRQYDWIKQIQQTNLNQILNNDPTLQGLIANTAQEEMSSYLVQKYNVADEFTDTDVFSYTDTYGAASRVELNFPAFDPTATYFVGDGAAVGTNQYLATSNNGPGSFQPMDWALVGQQYALEYVPFPYPRFDYLAAYRPGMRVYWQGSVYQCLRETAWYDHQAFLQARTYAHIGPPNAFPGLPTGPANNINDSFAQWGYGTPYGFSGYWPGVSAVSAWSSGTAYTAGQFVTYANPSWPGSSIWYCAAGNTGNAPGADIVNWLPLSWVLGDNRSQQMVLYMVDVALYHMHSRISPQNVPDLREKRYERAIKWLVDAAKGNVTPLNLELQQPEYGARIWYGGNVKSTNVY